MISNDSKKGEQNLLTCLEILCNGQLMDLHVQVDCGWQVHLSLRRRHQPFTREVNNQSDELFNLLREEGEK